MLEVKGKADRKIKGYKIAFEGLTSKQEGTLGGGSQSENGVVLGELRKAIVGAGVGQGESAAS